MFYLACKSYFIIVCVDRALKCLWDRTFESSIGTKIIFVKLENVTEFLQAFALTFRHRASSIYDSRFATLQRTLFVYLINKYISLSDICLTVHH